MVSFKVISPATSANLGPGFDCLGLALDIYNTYTITTSDKYIITGCPEEFQNEDNLFITSYKKACAYMNKQANPLHVHIDFNIPVSSGLGSSAACIIAGILAASHIHDDCLTNDDIFYLATQIEGHPDNVVPCFLGSLCSSFIDDHIITNQLEVSDDIKMVAFIPNYTLSTAMARKVLPEMISYTDAVYNLSRIPALIEGFKNADYKLLHTALKDKLHEQYRKPLLKDYDIIKDLTKDFVSLNISGAGPTLLGIYENADIDYIKEHLPETYTLKCVHIDKKGAYIISNEQ